LVAGRYKDKLGDGGYNKTMTVIIRNGLIYDGRGEPPRRGDIFIRGEKIMKIGNFLKVDADLVIDATNALVMPGFVDINTDSDHYLSLFYEPYQTDFVSQGITTIIGGSCGASLAPLINWSLDSIKKWSAPSHFNLNWQNLAQFLTVLKDKKIGVNFGTLIGHNTIRGGITRGSVRDLTQNELTMFKKILSQAFQEGGFGLSLALSRVHSQKVNYYELNELMKFTAEAQKVCAVHLSLYDGYDSNEILDEIKNILELARNYKANLEISHFQPIKGFANLYEEGAALIEKESAQGFINFDIYPFDYVALTIDEFLPSWTKEDGSAKALEYIFARHLEQRLLEYLWRFAGNRFCPEPEFKIQ